MFALTVFFLIIAAVGVFIVLYFYSLVSFVDFFMVCSHEGITARGVLTLWGAAWRNKTHNVPLEIFKDGKFLNRCILDITKQKDAHPENSKRWNYYIELLDVLYEIRQAMALRDSSRVAVNSSRDLPEDSHLSLTVAGLGGAVYHSRIVSNTNTAMVVSYPTGPRLPANFSWRGKQVLVSLQVGGASFRFAMTFDENYWDQTFSTLSLLHSDSFTQEQKRSEVRYNVHIPATFSLLADVEGADEELTNQRSVVKDLSLGGCRILIDGVIPSERECQLIIRLNGNHILVRGITRQVDYIETDNFSYVRIQFIHIERPDLQRICSFIYGIEVSDDEIPPTPQENSAAYGLISEADQEDEGLVLEAVGLLRSEGFDNDDLESDEEEDSEGNSLPWSHRAQNAADQAGVEDLGNPLSVDDLEGTEEPEEPGIVELPLGSFYGDADLPASENIKVSDQEEKSLHS